MGFCLSNFGHFTDGSSLAVNQLSYLFPSSQIRTFSQFFPAVCKPKKSYVECICSILKSDPLPIFLFTSTADRKELSRSIAAVSYQNLKEKHRVHVFVL